MNAAFAAELSANAISRGALNFEYERVFTGLVIVLIELRILPEVGDLPSLS